MTTFEEDVDLMKKEIRHFLNSSFNVFAERHGVKPSLIRVNVVDVTTVGDHHKKFEVTGVEMEFRL